MNIRLFILFGLIIFHSNAESQITRERIQRLLHSAYQLDILGISHQQELKELYKTTNYCPVWINLSGRKNREVFINMLQNAANEGLDQEDYQYDFISSFSEEAFVADGMGDSLAVELKFSDAALHFFTDMAYGNRRPVFGYDGLNFSPSGYDIPGLLAKHCSRNELDFLFEQLIHPIPEIKSIREKLAHLNSLYVGGMYQEEKIISTQVNYLNKPLLQKLYLLGIADSISKRPDKNIRDNLKEAQRQFNLLADGVLRTTAQAELNVPLKTRIGQLKLAINYYRWLFCLSGQQPVIVVNTPAAYLKVYAPGGLLLEMKIIVGKPSTPTPTLTSIVTEVILYPYWRVPHSIATKELLPAIKRNPGYIDANNFQVLTSQGKIVDPYKINWQSLSASNFPYIIRQSTGCDNALGLIKLNFYNPVGVYLHDTPDKGLFMLNKRYFSHGCMRMEKPMELGHLVLKNNAIAIDTLEEKGCIRNQLPITVPADEKMPVVVWYNPVGTDETGRVVFYEDVYKKFTGRNAIYPK